MRSRFQGSGLRVWGLVAKYYLQNASTRTPARVLGIFQKRGVPADVSPRVNGQLELVWELGFSTYGLGYKVEGYEVRV